MKGEWKPRAYREDNATLGVDYILRGIALQRRGLIDTILCFTGIDPQYFLTSSVSDPWGEKRPISRRELRALIEDTERIHGRIAA